VNKIRPLWSLHVVDLKSNNVYTHGYYNIIKMVQSVKNIWKFIKNGCPKLSLTSALDDLEPITDICMYNLW